MVIFFISFIGFGGDEQSKICLAYLYYILYFYIFKMRTTLYFVIDNISKYIPNIHLIIYYIILVYVLRVKSYLVVYLDDQIRLGWF